MATSSPGNADQVAEETPQILRLEAIATGRGRETEERSAAPVPSAREEDDPFLEEGQEVPGPLAVHAVCRGGGGVFKAAGG